MFGGSDGCTSGDSCKTLINNNQRASDSLGSHTVHWMASVGTLWTPVGPNTTQTIAASQQRSRLAETFRTREKLLPQNQPGAATHTIRKDSGNPSTYITVEQANAQKFIINTNCLCRTGTKLSNQHANNLLKGTIQQDLSKSNGLSVPLFISTQKQMQQLPKESNHHKHVFPKAIAIVTPLTQRVVESTASKTHSTDNNLNLLVTGQKKSAFGSSHISVQMNISQNVLPQSTSLMCRNLAPKNSGEPMKCSRKRLCSEPFETVTEEKKMRTLPCSAVEVNVRVSTPKPPKDLDMQRGIKPPSQQPAMKEWSLHSLRHLISQLEECQIQQQKEPCFSDLRTEILRLFWDGDYKQLFTANKNNLYLNIMSEVKHYCNQNSSMILTEISEETKSQMGHNFLLLEHDHAPPALEHQTSWLNLNKNLDDIDIESGYSPLLMASHNTLKDVNERLIKKHTKVDGKTPEHEINSSDLVEGVRTPACVCIVNKDIQEKVLDHAPSEKPPKAIIKNTKANTSKILAQDSQIIHVDQSSILFKYLMAEKLEKGSDPVQETFSSTKPNSPSSDPAETTITEGICETPQKVSDYETKKAADLLIDTQQSLNMKPKNKSEHRILTKIIFHYRKVCCLPRWFQMLGYRNGGRCVCEKALLSRQVNGTNVVSARSVQSYTGSLDEVKIGEIITDYKKIQKLAAAESPPKAVTPHKHRLVKKKKHHRKKDHYAHDDHTGVFLPETKGQNPNPESRTKERIINLALFGSSSQHQATTSRYTPKRLDHMPPPPATLHIRVSSDVDHSPNSSTNLSTKQRILNSWRKSYVPTNVPGKRRSSKLKGARKTAKGASRIDRNLTTIRLIKARLKKDLQKPSTLPGKHNHLDQSRRQQVEEGRKLEKSDPTVSNSSNEQNGVQQRDVRNSLSVQSNVNTSSKKEKLNKDFLLNFNVLPESFSLTQGSTGKMDPCIKNNQGSNIKSATPMKPSLGPHGAWHFNRKRKRPVGPTVPASKPEPSSTFQQFKRRYEDKQRKLPS